MKHQQVTVNVVLALLVMAMAVPGAQEPTQEEPRSNPEIVVPDGTVIPIVLTAYLNTRSTQVGDRLYAETAYPIWIQQRLIIPRGSVIRGTVTEVVRPGKIKGKGRMAIRFDDVLLPNGITRPIVAGLRGIHGPGGEKIDRTQETVEMDGSTGADVGTVVGTTTSGAVIGSMAGHGWDDAGIGAGIGAAAGAVAVLFTRGRELILSPGTQFDLELKRPLRFVFAETDFSSEQLDGARRSNPPRPGYERDYNRRPHSSGIPRFPVPWFSPWPPEQ